MRKVRLNVIIIFVVVATIALLFIQAFQTNQLFAKKREQFSANVQTTLERIAMRHEKAENMKSIAKVANKNIPTNYKELIKAELQNRYAPTETVSIKDIVIWKNGKRENYLLVQGETFDSLIGLTAEQRILTRDLSKIDSYYPKVDSLGVKNHMEQSVVKKLFNRAKYINDLMLQAYREDLFSKNSLDIQFMDSILQVEFAASDLPKNYKFAVLDQQNNVLIPRIKSENYNSTLNLNNTYSTLLFPSNLFENHQKLYVYFNTKNTFLLKELWLPLLVNLSLIMLIFWALIYMFKTILTQKKLSDMRNDFISNMTHEFRTPISTISLACQALNDKDVMECENETASPFIQMIVQENERLSTLVNGILQSNTLEKGDLQLKKENLILNEVVLDVVQRAKLRVEEKTGVIEIVNHEELITILADRLHLTNVISNLLDNAIKYSNNSPDIKIKLSNKQNLIRLEVSDKGIGIKKEHLNKIFDKLYRIPTGNVHNVKGFGLGLSYVKGICDLHGWEINVHSKFNHGSTFTLEIKQ